jgi:peptidoglycan/LPS O-acetylase OafA/YrhL
MAGGAGPDSGRDSSWLRLDVQGLRAIAILLVVTFHAGLPIPGGFTGVDVFFVISGYVITGLILRRQSAPGGFRLRSFYAARMRRLLPALGLMTTVTVVAAVFLESPFGPQRTTALTGLGASFFAANFVIYENTGGYFDAPAELNPLLHTWSLSVEEQFYFVLPSVMVLIGWLALRRRFPARSAALVALAAIALISFLAAMTMSMGWWAPQELTNPASWAFYSSATRAWEFCVGGIVALALPPGERRPRPTLTNALGVLGVAAIICGALLIGPETPFPGFAALLPVLGSAAVITAGSLSHNSPVARALSIPVLTWIGGVSYSWYLWHWPILVFTGQLTLGNEIALLMAGVLSLIPAWLAYRYVENPIRRSRRVRGGRAVAVIALAIAIPALASLGLLAGAQRTWGIPAIQAMAQQIQPVPVSFTRGCDNGVPLGQQQDLECTWHAGARAAPVYLVGDSQAGQFAEAFIGATKPLERPLTIATAGSCPFITTLPDEEPLQSPECGAFVDSSVEWLTRQAPGTVVIGMSGNYITPQYAGEIEKRLVRTIEALSVAGHTVTVLQAIPQFTEWDPYACTMLDVVRDGSGCGVSVPQAAMDERQADALSTLASAARATGARLVDVREQICPDGLCGTNDGDAWRYRDMFHISVGQSQSLVDAVLPGLL